MKIKIGRRDFSKLTLCALVACAGSAGHSLSAQERGVINKDIEVEQRLGARLGLAILDEESGRRWNDQAGQRFFALQY